MLKDIDNLQGAVDAPDERDYSAPHLFGDPVVELPSSVNLNKTPSHNQGKTWHCTAYALTHCMEIMNTIEFAMQALADPEEQWANQKYERGNPEYMEKEGDSLQNALNALLKYGLNNKSPDIKLDKFRITGYAKILNTNDDIKKWLARGYPVYTGAGRHCFCIVGYHDGLQAFQAKNSLKADPFDIKYDETGKLFSKYILHDKIDMSMLFKDVSENSPMASSIKRVADLGIMRGYGNSDNPLERLFMPDKALTRAEVCVIICNIIDKFSLHA